MVRGVEAAAAATAAVEEEGIECGAEWKKEFAWQGALRRSLAATFRLAVFRPLQVRCWGEHVTRGSGSDCVPVGECQRLNLCGWVPTLVWGRGLGRCRRRSSTPR